MVNRPQTISKLELAGTEAIMTMYIGIVVQYLQVLKKNSLSQLAWLTCNSCNQVWKCKLHEVQKKERERRPELGESCLGPVIAIFHILCSIRKNRAATLPDTSICMHFSPVFFIFSRHRYRETHTIPAGYCHRNIQYLENQQDSTRKSHGGPSKRLHALHPAEKEKALIFIYLMSAGRRQDRVSLSSGTQCLTLSCRRKSEAARQRRPSKRHPKPCWNALGARNCAPDEPRLQMAKTMEQALQVSAENSWQHVFLPVFCAKAMATILQFCTSIAASRVDSFVYSAMIATRVQSNSQKSSFSSLKAFN